MRSRKGGSCDETIAHHRRHRCRRRCVGHRDCGYEWWLGTGKSGRATVSIKRISGAGRSWSTPEDARCTETSRNTAQLVLCTGECVSFWKPLVVHGKPTGKSLPGKLGVAKRPGGARQVTYQGNRLYTFTPEGPGKVTGDGAIDAFGGHKFTWHVAHPTAKNSSTPPPTSTTPYPY